jgi:heat shock protein HtpX
LRRELLRRAVAGVSAAAWRAPLFGQKSPGLLAPASALDTRRTFASFAFCLERSGRIAGPVQAGVRQNGKAQPSLAEIGARMHAAHRQPQAVLQALGATPLQCADAPDLYAILLNVCVRAGLERVPELFLLPAPGMNAYALGTPDNACISVTAGLLSGLSREEIAGILAHELAHILHHDTSAMNWAAAIHGEIVSSAQHGVAGLTAWRDDLDRVGPRALLLVAAPALARLLYFALSRDRELAADAIAVELIDHPGALTAALCKLEYFHSGLSPLRAHMKDNAVSNPLRSHPGTWERIFHLA